jgi:hypothetical protein
MLVERTCQAGLLCVRQVTSINVGLAVWPNNEDHGCAKGNYCPRGTPNQIACKKGTYNPIRAGKNENDCLLTTSGTFVNTTGAITFAGYCERGHYCPEGSIIAAQEKCPNGTYRHISGGKNPKDCAPCPPGRFCKQAGTYAPVDCPKGSYCPVGTIDPEPCPVGTYGDVTLLQESKDCKPCPPG